MKNRIAALALSGAMILGLAACGGSPVASPSPSDTPAAETKTLTGHGEGYEGEITVTVTTVDGKITDVKAEGPDETPDVGGQALEPMTQAIVQAGKTEGVDTVSGATYTSQGVLYAVNNALDPAAYPYPVEKEPEPSREPTAAATADLYQGVGVVSNGRIGPGKDDTDTPVYSFNTVVANALFDGDGKIVDLQFDEQEVATPNYDGKDMPAFSGFPGQGGYNNWDDAAGKVNGKTSDTEDNYLAEIAAWNTKRERGDSYKLNSGTWAGEMDAYQKLFVGMTVDEVEQWFAAYTDKNGRPLKSENKDAADQAKYDALSQADKDMLADVVSSATISLKDPHGDFLAALRKAYDNRVPRPGVTSVKGIGVGMASNGRIGPGKDDTDTPVYSFNTAYANTLFDGDGRIAAITIDITEVATPNSDGKDMPTFSGFPGQGGYNKWDAAADKVNGKTSDTEDNYLAEIAAWRTKRERGDSYKLNSGTFASEMDAYESIFTGMTVDEVEQWFAAYTDKNGRPLKAENKDAADQAKYDALSQADKDMLADVVSSATISLKDPHGDILQAIRNSLTNMRAVDITVG